jgi:DNA-binding winged helix-turn-helix (wHTH) protein
MKPASPQDKEVEFEFAGFRLDPAARKLSKCDGGIVKLNSRAFDTLAALVARPGETLTKRFLLNAVWPDVVVGDNNLNQAIAAIRRALGDSGAPRQIVQTIPGRGFCFVAEVRVSDAARPASGAEPRRDTIVTVADYF